MVSVVSPGGFPRVAGETAQDTGANGAAAAGEPEAEGLTARW